MDIKELIDLATQMDAEGLTEEASALDACITKLAAEEEDLGKAFTEKAKFLRQMLESDPARINITRFRTLVSQLNGVLDKAVAAIVAANPQAGSQLKKMDRQLDLAQQV